MPRRRANDLLVGINLLPERRLAAFSPDDFELVIRHWLDGTRKDDYEQLLHYGGPNDKGRDVVGRLSRQPNSEWDNFQCKRYEDKLESRRGPGRAREACVLGHEGRVHLPPRLPVCLAPRRDEPCARAP